MPPDLEDRLDQPKPKPDQNTLESKVNGLFSTIKTSAFMTGTLAATYLTGGANLFLDAASIAAGLIVGKLGKNYREGRSTTMKQVAQEGVTGSLVGALAGAAFDVTGFESLSRLGKIAYSYGIMLPFMATHYAIDHVVRNYNPVDAVYNAFSRPFSLMKEIYQKNIRPTFFKSFGKIFTYVQPLWALNMAFSPRYLLMPVFGVLDAIYGYVTAQKQKLEAAQNKKQNAR